MFETLITEWGHKRYAKNEMCSDLGAEMAEMKAIQAKWLMELTCQIPPKSNFRRYFNA